MGKKRKAAKARIAAALASPANEAERKSAQAPNNISPTLAPKNPDWKEFFGLIFDIFSIFYQPIGYIKRVGAFFSKEGRALSQGRVLFALVFLVAAGPLSLISYDLGVKRGTPHPIPQFRITNITFRPLNGPIYEIAIYMKNFDKGGDPIAIYSPSLEISHVKLTNIGKITRFELYPDEERPFVFQTNPSGMNTDTNTPLAAADLIADIIMGRRFFSIKIYLENSSKDWFLNTTNWQYVNGVLTILDSPYTVPVSSVPDYVKSVY